MKKLITIFLTIAPILVFAEYRVYQYQVVSRFPGEYQAKPHVVTSTLDPVSYLSYHGGETSIAVDLMRSWTCQGHTGGMKDYCLGPAERSIAQENEMASVEVKKP